MLRWEVKGGIREVERAFTDFGDEWRHWWELCVITHGVKTHWHYRYFDTEEEACTARAIFGGMVCLPWCLLWR